MKLSDSNWSSDQGGKAMTTQYEFTSNDFHRVRAMFRSSTGVMLGHHTRDLVYNRMSQRVDATYSRDFSQYLDRVLIGDGNELGEFTRALAAQSGSFFRAQHQFAALREHLKGLHIPGALLWSCAAGTGEEAYSMAMTAHDALNGDVRSVKILATDIDLSALAFAEAGNYPAERLRNVPQHFRQKYFTRLACREEVYQIAPEIRRMVSFLPFNLASAEWVLKGKYDAVFCREVFDHFDPRTQQALVARMAGMLKSGGLLCFGDAEPHLEDQRFEGRGGKVYALKPTFGLLK
ncbi:methyltransferase domain-containing protein [Geomonas terrae]|uniref:protein-glutamate O-methyltransferase n=2 Tax=Geomonas terrae TaxID=2562681 RepID=A0A4S1CDQ4_9BACT|nr:methyltransferase domain-containing protein [Geomonas terrae]